MALNIKQKKAVIEEVTTIMVDTQSVVAAEYSGLSVSDMTELRRKAMDMGVIIRVIKNTLAKRVLAETDYACMNDVLTGPIVLAFSQESLGGAARVMREFAKDHNKLKVTGLSLGGELLDASQLKAIADLPNLDEALSMLLSVMKAPVEKLARTLNEIPTKATRVVAAVRDQKEAA